MSNTTHAEPSIQWRTLSIDCADADLMADFYSRLLGWEIARRGGSNPETGGSGWVTLSNPAGGVALAFGSAGWYEPPVWPEEPGALAKMMHFEIGVDDLDASVALVVDAGGRVAPHQPDDRDQDALRIMLDPAGHPFCLFVLS
ncbi:MAG TPA: VOC family protein [Actinopolymorphaceae bacterium]|jgi:catechol 2,3-dioxygenase-like lactoylglutathione lyase family enzyme|nr:VOC family protein [Actinopolymorphaceae bacterium]